MDSIVVNFMIMSRFQSYNVHIHWHQKYDGEVQQSAMCPVWHGWTSSGYGKYLYRGDFIVFVFVYLLDMKNIFGCWFDMNDFFLHG